jgi:hypothetical protein
VDPLSRVKQVARRLTAVAVASLYACALLGCGEAVVPRGSAGTESAAGDPAPTMSSTSEELQLSVLSADVELQRFAGEGSRKVAVSVPAGTVAFYLVCSGQPIEVRREGGTDWDVPCDRVVSRREVFGIGPKFTLDLRTESSTEWLLLIARAKSG